MAVPEQIISEWVKGALEGSASLVALLDTFASEAAIFHVQIPEGEFGTVVSYQILPEADVNAQGQRHQAGATVYVIVRKRGESIPWAEAALVDAALHKKVAGAPSSGYTLQSERIGGIPAGREDVGRNEYRSAGGRYRVLVSPAIV